MNTQIYEEASEWVVRHRTDGMDEQARRRFDDWLRQSPQHVRAYLEISSIWEGVPQIDAALNPDAEQLIEQARAHGNVVSLSESVEPQPRPASSVGRTRLYYSLAASLIVALGIAGWVYQQRGVHSTGVGEQRTFALKDGSVIELNARSRIKVRYDDRERAVDLLEGQALFRVARDPARPFIVASGGTHVRAVGTQFDVYKKSTATVVTVVEGRVAVTAPVRSGESARPDGEAPTDHRSSEPGSASVPVNSSSRAAEADTASPQALQLHQREVFLGAGEQLVIAQSVLFPPRPADIDAVTAWRQQRLVFDDTPLPEVAEEFNRYNHRQLVIEDGGLRTFRVSGSFSSTDPTLLLRFLRAQPGILVDEAGDEIRISRRAADVG
jgi:transmembrane sensor